MSQRDYDAAKHIIDEHTSEAHFVGPRQPEIVDAAEATLGLRFPPTYRQFVSEFGAGSLHGHETYGVIDQDWEATVPDGVGLTLRDRENFQLPPAFIVIGDSDDGDRYVLDTSQTDADGEAPVLRWMPGVRPDEAGPPERLADSFGSFLLEELRFAVQA
jgi:hypothetical protein